MTTPSPTLPAQESALPAPCPFCAGSPSVARCGFGTARVVCMDCGSEGTYSQSQAEAIAAWNRRASPPVQQGVVDALEKALTELWPRTAYGIPGSRDVEQARWRAAVESGLAALASLRPPVEKP